MGSTRREFLRGIATGAACMLGAGERTHAREATRPNVLFILTDDQRFDSVHALGTRELHTPNMDGLVRRGFTFTRAHIMGGTVPAVCMPSRAMLMTGRNLFHLQRDGAEIPESDRTLPEVFREAGYETFATGKWHNGPAALNRGFTNGAALFFGGMHDHRAVPTHPLRPDGVYTKENATIAATHSSELFSDAAIDFLTRRDPSRPFFAYVSYTAPHDPRSAPDEFHRLYPPDRIPLPRNFLSEHPFDNGELRVRDELLAPFPRTPDVIRRHIADYFAMITHLDAQIGRVLAVLDDTGMADRTIVVFASDNGLAVGQHGLLGKQSLYEHSIRVPLVVAGPGIPTNKRNASLCYLHDVFPTLCDLTGLQTPETVESISLAGIIRGRQRRVRETVFGAYRRFQRMIQKDEWKLIQYNAGGAEHSQLFNLSRDPYETKDLSETTSHRRTAARLHELLIEQSRQLDDPCRLNEKGWGDG